MNQFAATSVIIFIELRRDNTIMSSNGSASTEYGLDKAQQKKRQFSDFYNDNDDDDLNDTVWERSIDRCNDLSHCKWTLTKVEGFLSQVNKKIKSFEENQQQKEGEGGLKYKNAVTYHYNDNSWEAAIDRCENLSKCKMLRIKFEALFSQINQKIAYLEEQPQEEDGRKYKGENAVKCLYCTNTFELFEGGSDYGTKCYKKGCERMVCTDCWKTCEECGEFSCRSCVQKCACCGEDVCKNCEDVCDECGVICGQCSTSFGARRRGRRGVCMECAQSAFD